LVIGGVAWSEWRLLRARAAAERSFAAPNRAVD
jgi:hypothetical protein